jgi:hypothetical protein
VRCTAGPSICGPTAEMQSRPGKVGCVRGSRITHHHGVVPDACDLPDSGEKKKKGARALTRSHPSDCGHGHDTDTATLSTFSTLMHVRDKRRSPPSRAGVPPPVPLVSRLLLQHLSRTPPKMHFSLSLLFSNPKPRYLHLGGFNADRGARARVASSIQATIAPTISYSTPRASINRGGCEHCGT